MVIARFGMTKKLWLLLFLLTFFALSSRLYRFTEPKGYYFDEVYHAVTAKAYADNNPAAYDPFAPPPKKDTAYDWLHPPLAKLIQAASIKAFGDNPIGWRLPSVIFGTAIVPATFYLGFLLFGKRAAFFGAIAIAFENLTLVMSRITMNDIFVTFFIVMSFIFFKLHVDSKKFIHLFLTGVFLGFSVGSKWTGIYAVGVIALLLFFNSIKNRRFDGKILIILVLPAIFYLLSYGQYWLQGHSIEDFVNLHKQIWWYQNRHDLKHSYGTTPLYCLPEGLGGPKQWCPWVLDARGVYFSYEKYGEEAGYIYAIGNPIMFWVGVVAVSYLIGKLAEKKSWELIYILAGYFIFWVPWIFSPRIMFLYHYLPSIPFMAVAIGYMLNDIYKSKYRLVSILLLGAIALTFVYFYPITTGLPIKVDDISKYMLIKSWR